MSAQPCGCDYEAQHQCERHLCVQWNAQQNLVRETYTHADITMPQGQVIPGVEKCEHSLPIDPKERKTYPVGTGVIDYFPDALAAVAHVSFEGNEQHNPGTPLHWDRSKSTDEADALMRHFIERGKRDSDGLRHSAKMAWRALALLQKELETVR